MNLCLTYYIMCTHWLLFVLLTLTFGLPTGRTPQGIAIMVHALGHFHDVHLCNDACSYKCCS